MTLIEASFHFILQQYSVAIEVQNIEEPNSRRKSLRMKTRTMSSSARPVFGPWKLLIVLASFCILVVSCTDESRSGSSSSSSPSPSPSSSTSTSSQSSSLPSKTGEEQEPRSRTKVISLAESISRSQKYYQDPQRAKASKEQWDRALLEIKNLALPPTTLSSLSSSTTTTASSNSTSTSVSEKAVQLGSVNLFKQWRLLLDEPTLVELDLETNMTTAETKTRGSSKSASSDSISSDSSSRISSTVESSSTTTSSLQSTSKSRRIGPPRFEGFASWERMVQEWADDVQDYMDKIEAESPGYPMSTYGNPLGASSSTNKKSATTDGKDTMAGVDDKEKEKNGTNRKILSKEKKKPISLPVPAPAKDGEEVLPHTNIADKSKNIWIVTTAALPWMTGTAVNPILRAAYMTDGRDEAGGSVTLMLPWLERIIDQETVYGVNRVFDSPMAQEEYIRTWIRDTANLSAASERLRIKWYTAWQSKVENSVYSMGDITALIPAEEVDICILEEPEHLNWYVIK
jgi:hypothetical protein